MLRTTAKLLLSIPQSSQNKTSLLLLGVALFNISFGFNGCLQLPFHFLQSHRHCLPAPLLSQPMALLNSQQLTVLGDLDG
ncbi:hypothetical protein STEG23_028808 [Scotinomys teguina]